MQRDKVKIFHYDNADKDTTSKIRYNKLKALRKDREGHNPLGGLRKL